MFKSSRLCVALCALALGIGAQFSQQANAVGLNGCLRACAGERGNCLRHGGGDYCFDAWSDCIANCP